MKGQRRATLPRVRRAEWRVTDGIKRPVVVRFVDPALIPSAGGAKMLLAAVELGDRKR